MYKRQGWKRASRTIWASKAVNLLAAAVLYFVAVGNVRGFAFTLGLTAIADLIVVFWFTHPMMVLLSQTRFIGGGHRMSGLDPSLLGREPLYKGAGRVREFKTLSSDQKAQGASGGAERRRRRSRGEAARRQTIAERRRAEREAASPAAGTTTTSERTQEDGQ